MEISLNIDKEKVMHEVAVTTSYTGEKMDADKTAAERIPTVDEDVEHLERFWGECRSDICQELIGLVREEGMVRGEPGIYQLTMEVSRSFDEALLPSMRLSLMSYFVQAIVAKWYIYTNKEEAGAYADKAATLLDDIHRKAMHKKKPTRPTYSN